MRSPTPFTTPPPFLPGSYLVLELTNHCDSACVHCACRTPHHPHLRRRGHVRPALVEALLHDLGRSGARFESLVLFWLGEPLLHPAFTELYPLILRLDARYRIFNRIELHTNAFSLDEGIRAVAVNRARTPQVWHFSLDARRPETYRRIKGRDALERVEENVAALVALTARRSAPWPRPVFQFILSDRNVDEAAPFRYHWSRVARGAGIEVRTAAGHLPAGDDAVIFYRQLDCPTAEEQERQNQVFRTAVAALGLSPGPLDEGEPSTGGVRPLGNRPCAGYWKSPVISWEGEVTVCTRDAAMALRVGDLRQAVFSAIWWGPAMRRLRARVARGQYDPGTPCRDCFIPSSANYTGVDPVEIRRMATWQQRQASHAEGSNEGAPPPPRSASSGDPP